ncbi:uncharacterized protein LOC111715279 isoform X2 [Eurytemora carolleeae]|uniref:uncharacterized protein LOC111715279 isoform X2 n=1 Tax=Eurytemora carolleeae TaxID=1294199 RepID=UPI000C76D501|nr:uncharacterized protein LOC111715279 isoform X2 [Eurytemora carolleeae]|eukprot:XP_023346357.1 uncharacterized protein LOC111715279 isoform X2 [Eurytemora affinis]
MAKIVKTVPELQIRKGKDRNDGEGISRAQGPERLDTITSQSEVDPSDTEIDFQPSNQNLERVKDQQSFSPFSPLDPRFLTGSPDTRPSSAGSEVSFKTPFGKTATSGPVRDIYAQIKPNQTSRKREESQSPDRSSRPEARGRHDHINFSQPLVRTQSAVPIHRNLRAESIEPKEPRVRSASVTPGQTSLIKPSSVVGGSTSSLRGSTYRLLGGRLVEGFQSRYSSDEAGISGSRAPPSFTILKEPSHIVTKDGRRQTMAEYEKQLIQDYKRRSQQNLTL